MNTKINRFKFEGKHGPLLIAEIGGNHEGNYEYAKELTLLAIESGVDAIKFQIYTGESLVSAVESPERVKHFKNFELTNEQNIELAEMVVNAGLLYSASVWDVSAISWLDKYIAFYKIGSGDLTAYSVIQETIKLGKPIVISTGLSTEQEVFDVVKFIQSCDTRYENPEMLALLQCTSMYPIPYQDANLTVMNRLEHLLGLPIGYSDHTEGSKALQYAAAMGAKILEFHFTDSREGKQFRDHKVSLTKDEVKSLIMELEILNLLKGNSKKQPTDIEITNGHLLSFRRAIYPKYDLKAGTILTMDNLDFLRPNNGIDARDFNNVLGKILLVDVNRGEKLDWMKIK